MPSQQYETLGELIARYTEHQGVPDPEDLISESPTRHVVSLGERRVYAHCFLDALILPLVLGAEPAEVRSTSPASGEEVRTTVSAGGVEGTPPGVTVALGLSRTEQGPPQMVGCPYINAFRSKDEYERWAADNPQVITMPLSVQDTFTLARDVVDGAEGRH